jgi:hypothetical protein
MKEPIGITLAVKHLVASQFIDDEVIAGENVEVRCDYAIRELAWQLTAVLKTPAQVLQDNRVIAEYPDGLWQHIRKKLGLTHRSNLVRLTEWLTFPTVAVPPIQRPMRIYVHAGVTAYDTGFKE